MRKVLLGKSGLEVSAVGFGGIPIQRIGQDEAVGVLRRALDLGVTFIDTATGYSDSQLKIGAAVKGRRDGLVLATKSGDPTRDGVLRDVERSRQQIGVDVIDLYQLHSVSDRGRWEKVSGPGGALEGLLEARDAGHVGHIGVTSHNLDLALEMIEHPAFETVQFPFNLVTSEPADELVPKVRELGLGFIVMKPLCGGQYDNARLAMKFLNGYPDLVAIPGIQRAEEIEEIVSLVESGEMLQGDEKAEAAAIVAELGKLFCRRCGYCQPCPQGVAITMAMTFEGAAKRMPREQLVKDWALRVARVPDLCVECGECEEKCPYDLPIIETIKRTGELARAMMDAV
ncbi:MAG: aldo/keto reductase [Candidatus Brocadiae bacterium]|nr:aldo/keto reductase [Candidatus Brocadiia bacterium]